MASPPKKAPRRLSPEEIRARHAGDPMVRSRTAGFGAAPSGSGQVAAQPTVNAAHGTDRPEPTLQGSTRDRSTESASSALPAVPLTAAKDEHSGNVWSITSAGRINHESRADFLANVWPTGRRQDLEIVRPIIVSLVLDTDVTSTESLRSLLGRGCHFASWCLSNTPDGRFDPERDLTEDRIQDFRVHALTDLMASSQGTYMSALRQLGTNAPKRRSLNRPAASPPYPPLVARRIWQTALELDDWTAEEMRTLLALTLGAGARSEEIKEMRAGQIEAGGRQLIVCITRKHVVREVPVYGEYAQWLRHRVEQIAPDSHLLRPNYSNRRNVVNDLIAKASKRSNVFDGFKSVRARHTWACHYLAIGVPFNALCFTAGVGVGSNLFADLSPHLPSVTPVDARRALHRAQDTHEDLE